ncbi:HET-domain-containing protein [Hypoxylon sp. FL1284]|nr:HET-domain-containing protein [Hypoxylon sp. FL1284]
MSSTYRDLITAISPSLNLSNVTDASPSRLCAACARLVPDRLRAEGHKIKTDYELLDTFPEFPVLKASAKAGCMLCRLLRKTIRSSWAVSLRPMEEHGLGVLSAKDGLWDDLFGKPWDRQVRIFHGHFRLSSRGLHQDDHSEQFIQNLSIRFGPANLPAEEDDWPYKRQIYQVLMFNVFDSVDACEIGNVDDSTYTRRPPDQNALSPLNIELMKSWISTCKNHHAACRLDASADWLPTRLIQIAESEGLYVRLVETSKHLNKHLEPPVQFMALSHMWGDVSILPPLRTLKSNYDDLQQEISMEELPQNFLDAVLVCRGLGIEYVWIDSLCIIQDSPEDWKHEAVTMHLVYKYAQATIVAAAAKSSRDGFLVRNTSMTPAVKVVHASETGKQVGRSLILYPTNEESETDFEYEGSEWNTRGWTFQERYLSTRLIYFCRNVLQFECRTCKSSEEGETSLPGGRNNSLWPRTTMPTDAWFKMWTNMLIRYTARKLTYGRDKLIAVRSIVNEMKDHVPGPYIDFAGVWQMNIHRELLWMPWGAIPTYPDEYRAPSWCWASLDCGIAFSMISSYDRRHGEALEVVEFNEGALPTIVVKAYVRRIVSIVKTYPDDLFNDARKGGVLYNLLTDGLMPSAEDTQPKLFARGSLDRYKDEDGILEKQADLMYLHVCDSQQPTGLILKKRASGIRMDELVPDAWFRVGTASVFKDLRELPFASKGFEGQEKREVIIV